MQRDLETALLDLDVDDIAPGIELAAGPQAVLFVDGDLRAKGNRLAAFVFNNAFYGNNP